MARKPHPVWDDEQRLRDAAARASSITEMLSLLGLSPSSSGNFQTLHGRCAKYGIEEPKFDSSKCPVSAQLFNTLPVNEFFSDRGVKSSGYSLKKRMLADYNIPDECVTCQQGPVWFGKPLTLEVDHIDGNSFNNSIENLRILCGHCHSQTENFRGRNSNKAAYSYCICGRRITKKSTSCRACTKRQRKFAYLENSRYHSLQNVYDVYVKVGTFEALGAEFGVSSNAVRKYIRNHGIEIAQFRQGDVVQR